MLSRRRAASIPALLLLSSPLVAQSAWPQFRGPGGRCVAEGQAIPRDFGPDKHVAWSVELPGGHSSPCIARDRIFLTGNTGGTQDVVVALERQTGKELWRKSFEREPLPPMLHVDGGPTVSTPCTDGETVVAYLDGHGLVAFDLDGKQLWERKLPYPGYMFGVGPSPVIVGDVVVLPRDGAPEAAILAFDLADGSDRWKVDRFDYGESHGSPFVWKNAERTELIVGGTRRLCSFDPRTGEQLWTYDGITVFPCTTATADEETLYYAAWSTSNSSGRSFWEAGFGRSLELSDEEVEDPSKLFARLDADEDGHVTAAEVPECRAKDAFAFIDRDGSGTWEEAEVVGAGQMPQAPGANVMLAIAPGAKGTVEADHVRWTHKRGLPYVASPLLHRGRIWLFKAGGLVTCLDAETGKPIFSRERLSDRSEYYLSPVGVGDLVIAGSAEGTLYLLDADADELEVVHAVDFGEELFATPAVVDGTVYLRAKGRLWAFASGS